MKVVSTDSQGTCNDLDDLVHSRKEEAGLKQQIEKLGETLRRGRKRKIPITKSLTPLGSTLIIAKKISIQL
jgi:hypothetical protein